MRYWEIFWRLRKMHLMLLLEYRADFFFWGFVSSMWTVFNFFFTSVLVSISGNIQGWNQSEMFVLLSFFSILDAFTWSFFYFNMNRYVNRVFSGELDGFLLKPVDTQFLLSVEHNSYNNIFRFLIGFGILILSIRSLPQLPSVWNIAATALLLLFGLLLLYSLWFFTATFAFWVERLNNITEIIPSLRRLTQFPRDVYSGISSFIFCTIFPIVLITSIPAEVITQKSSVPWILYFLAASMCSFFIARWFFYFSLKKYSGAGA